jgi:hypothetical protein
MEFGRRVAIERDVDKSDALRYSNVGRYSDCQWGNVWCIYWVIQSKWFCSGK